MQVDINQLDRLTGPQLVQTFNSIPGVEPVKRFSSRQAGINRIRTLLSDRTIQMSLAAKQEEPAAAAEVKPAAEVKRRRRRARFVEPNPDGPSKYREGTKRAETIRLMRREGGASWNEIMEATGWDYRTAYDGVRLINRSVGFGITETDGRLIAFTAEEGAPQ